jgi:hypothetical protein
MKQTKWTPYIGCMCYFTKDGFMNIMGTAQVIQYQDENYEQATLTYMLCAETHRHLNFVRNSGVIRIQKKYIRLIKK